MIITYIVFGKNNLNYNQAAFSILTLLAQTKDEDKIVIITDNPENFNFLANKITTIEVNKEKLQEWKGEHDFFWRIKIKALLLIASKFDNRDILYLDSDTFLYGSLEKIRFNFSNGNNMMHLNEGPLSKLPTKTEHRMWTQIKTKKYAGVKIDSNMCMWNAGVIAIAARHTNQLTLALNICDEMCADNVTRRLIEQFAFSVAMNEPVKLLAAENEIGHYWSNKEMWNARISEFICDNHMKNIPLEKQISEARQIIFEDIPVRIKKSNTRRRLQKIICNLFPEKGEIYIRKAH